MQIKRYYAAIAFVLALHVAILTHGIFIHYPNIDEVGHLPAGAGYWRYGEFGLYKVNPPLVSLVSGLPAYLSNEPFDWSLYVEKPLLRPEFEIGLAKQQGEKLLLHRAYLWPRVFCIPFSVLGALLLANFCRSLMGEISGLVACTLWCSCPNILAHAQTIIPDVGSVSVGLAAIISFYKYLNRPRWESAALAGVILGLALLTKMTWLTAVFTLPFTAALCELVWWRKIRSNPIKNQFAHLMCCWSAALVVLNAGYLFEGAFTPLKSFEFLSQSLNGQAPGVIGNRFDDSWIGNVPVPVPKNYLLGIDFLRFEVERTYPSFLLGEWRSGSWWYYYCVTTLLKTPIPSLILAIIGSVALISCNNDHRLMSAWLMILVPTFCIFASVSYQGGFNHHHRYVLVIYLAIFFSAAICFSNHVKRRVVRASCWMLLALTLASSFSVFPHYLSYFNWLSGGPATGYQKLAFSNVDWGQDSLLVNQWIKSHPEEKEVYVRNGDGYEADFFGVKEWPVRNLPSTTIADLPDGVYIVRTVLLVEQVQRNGVPYFKNAKPIDRIGYSHFAYRVERRGDK